MKIIKKIKKMKIMKIMKIIKHSLKFLSIVILVIFIIIDPTLSGIEKIVTIMQLIIKFIINCITVYNATKHHIVS